MIYGDYYSQLSATVLRRVSGMPVGSLTGIFAKLYLKLFGYPDLASWMRFRLVTKHLKFTSQDKLLDVGSGNGIYANQYANFFQIHALGLEGRRERVERSRLVTQALSLPARFRMQNLEQARFPKRKFSKIICIEVLEHIVHDRRLLKKMVKSLKKGGTLMITVPVEKTGKSNEYENFEKFEHVRDGYPPEFFAEQAKVYSLRVKLITPYFFFFTKHAVAIQQWIYKHTHPLVNIISYPLLQIVSFFDDVVPLPGTARGLFVILRR